MTGLANLPVDQSVMAAIQAWVMSVTGLDILHVIPAHDNRVPPPGTPFIIVSHLSRKSYEVPGSSYNGTTQVDTISTGLDYVFQIDSYGINASDWALTMQTLFRSYPTASFFEAWGIANGFTIDPLYTDDATHTAIVNEESQYEERWTIKPHFCVVFSVATPMQSMTQTPHPGIINVQRTYPM
jgi:hypothetical protein